MTFKVFILSALLSCFFLAGTAAGQRQFTFSSAEKQKVARAFKEIDALMRETGSKSGPGCIYAASKKGKMLFSRSYGMAELENNVPITAETVFNVASIAKQFTAAAILLLAKDGKLNLSDDIRKYLPEMPDYGKPITIRHLLNHTSGLREWSDINFLSGRSLYWRFYSNADVFKITQRQRSLNHAPGERWSYTNTGYILLAIIVGRVSGVSLSEFTREQIFKPLGMKSTQWADDLRQVVNHRATGYYKAAAKTENPIYLKSVLDLGMVNGSEGLLTTAADLLKWNQALDSNLLGSFVTAELQRKTVLNDGRSIGYGAGLDIRDYQGQEWFEHGGTIPGFKGSLERFPRSQLSLTVLCNSGDADPRLIARKIADALLPAMTSQPESAKTDGAAILTSEQLNKRTGIFLIEQTGFPIVVSAEKGHLVVDQEMMKTVSENHFISPRLRGELVFKTSDLAERTINTQPDGLQTLRRLEATIPAENQLPEYTGRYVSDEAEGSYKIIVEKGALVLKGNDLDGRESGRSYQISPVAQDLFQMPNRMIRFNRDSDGRISSFDFTSERVRALRFRRS